MSTGPDSHTICTVIDKEIKARVELPLRHLDGADFSMFRRRSSTTARTKTHTNPSPYEALFEAVPEAIFVYASDGTILDVNAAACLFQQSTRSELIGSNIREKRASKESDSLTSPDWLIAGRRIPVEVRPREVNYDGVPATMIVVRDLSEQETIRKELLHMKDRSRSVLDISSDAILAANAECSVLWANKSAEALFGYTTDEIVGCTIGALIPSPVAAQEIAGSGCILGMAVDNSRTWQADASAVTKDGKRLPVEVTIKAVDLDEEDLFIAFVRDISQRRALEQEVLHGSEMERQSIGQDIHDHLASKFVGIALIGRALINGLPSTPVDAESLEYIVTQARSGASSARALARGLNPVALEQFGLKSALSELQHEVEVMSSLSCSLDVPDEIPGLEPAFAAQLYRIAHEAVTNTMKHAEAQQISIRVRQEGMELVMQIVDDGTGWTQETDPSQGMGLHIMDYRARTLQGRIQIQSSPNNGTTVVCSIPFPQDP